MLCTHSPLPSRKQDLYHYMSAEEILFIQNDIDIYTYIFKMKTFLGIRILSGYHGLPGKEFYIIFYAWHKELAIGVHAEK